ncbi:MAG: hypothetical protein PHS15_03675 [Clostridiaceae bacterium]|nr:hypothetical protein [Clostridiaceae bacterium]
MAVNDNGVDVCYNVQTVLDSKHKLIVDCDVKKQKVKAKGTAWYNFPKRG